MRSLPWKNTCFRVFLSLAGAVSLVYCINDTPGSLVYADSIGAFLLWAGWLYALTKLCEGDVWEKIAGNLRRCALFAACFFGSMAAGAQLDRTGAVDLKNWRIYAATAFLAVAASPLIGWILWKLEDSSCRSRAGDRNVRSGRNYLVTWLLLFLAYVPTFLASYPGFFTYDAAPEVYMVFLEDYSAHHPMLHVLLLGWTLRIAYRLFHSYNIGIAIYTVLQMLAMSACFAYMMNFLYRAGVKRWIRNAGTVFLALFPTVSMFVCCSTKDVLFSGGVVLLTTLLLEAGREGGPFWDIPKNRAVFAVSLLMILFFRNNGIYALALFGIPFAVVYKSSRKKWIRAALLSILIFAVSSAVMKQAFRFKDGEKAEMLSVPIQQMARVYTEKKADMPEEELEVLYELMPEAVLDRYDPKLADPVKVNFLEHNFMRSPGRYMAFWFKLGLRYPDIYINSFLVNTYGYWYPDTILDGYGRDGGKYENSSYFSFETEPPGERQHLFPALEGFYEKISLEIYQQKVPVLSMLFSPGFWHWIYIFLVMYCAAAKRGRQAFPLGVMGAVYLTVLLGPVALVRYVLYFFFLVPVALALLLDPAAL